MNKDKVDKKSYLELSSNNEIPFDGTPDYIDISNKNNINFSENITYHIDDIMYHKNIDKERRNLLLSIMEKIGYCEGRALLCRSLYNWFWSFTKGVSVSKETNDKNTSIRTFLIQSEHAYVLREYNIRKLYKEYYNEALENNERNYK